MKMIKLTQPIRQPKLAILASTKEKLCISTQAGHIIIRKNDISYLRADCNYCHINYEDNDLLCSQTLKSLEGRIQSSRFLKVHKSYVVNLEKIKLIDSAFTSIQMKDGSVIPIARAKKQLVRNVISKQFD